MGTIKSAVISKSGSRKLFECVKQSLLEMPREITSPLSIKDMEYKTVVLLPRHNSHSSSSTRAPKASEQIMLGLEKVLIETVKSLPLEPENACPCPGAIRNLRFE